MVWKIYWLFSTFISKFFVSIINDILKIMTLFLLCSRDNCILRMGNILAIPWRFYEVSFPLFVSHFHYLIQSNPLEKGNDTMLIDYKQPISHLSLTQRRNGFYGVLYTLFHTNRPPWKTGTKQYACITNRFRFLH